MAPNRSQVSRFPVQLDLESSNGKATFPPLTGQQQGNKDEAATSKPNQHHEGKKGQDVELFWEVSESAGANAAQDNYWVEESRHHHLCERNFEKERSDYERDARDLYWDWPSEERDQKSKVIATILKEEFARTQVSGDKITENLVKAAKSQAKTGEEQKAENDDYWQWESPEPSAPEYHGTAPADQDSYWDWKTVSKTEQKSQLVESILKEEATRVMFSADHIQKNMVQQAAAYASSQQAPDSNKANTEESDDYWTYPAKEGKGYWDFPGGPETSVVPVGGTNSRVSTNSYWAF